MECLWIFSILLVFALIFRCFIIKLDKRYLKKFREDISEAKRYGRTATAHCIKSTKSHRARKKDLPFNNIYQFEAYGKQHEFLSCNYSKDAIKVFYYPDGKRIIRKRATLIWYAVSPFLFVLSLIILFAH